MISLDRRNFTIGAAGLASGLLLGGGVSAMLLREDGKASLTLLGSGQSLSALISSERARVALLHGTDPADFGNALRQARVPLLAHTDITLVPDPVNTGRTFISTALTQLGKTRVYVSGNATPLLDAGIAVDEVLVAKTSIALPGDVTLEIEEPDEASWRARLTATSSDVAIVVGDGTSSIGAGPFTVWVQLQGALPASDQFAGNGPETIVIPASAMSGAAVREYQDAAIWNPTIVRVHAGEAKSIDLA
ncbi:MAG: hypothetical protein KF883_06245 [Thermomicrobiales bacterium]|nr:hypothetical protein [Thermomicrobiales bacterium]